MSHTALLESLDKIIGYVTQARAELNSTQMGVFSRLSSLQTVIRFMGSRISHEDTVVRELSTTISTAAVNINGAEPTWPFSSNDEQDIISALNHIESLLGSGQQQPSSVQISAGNVNPAPAPLHARSSIYAHGSSMQINAHDIHTGSVGGSILSNNTIMNADPAVRQIVDDLRERAIDADTLEKRKAFLDWISKLDFQATQMETYAKHALGTGDWFFKRPEFVDWRDGKTKFLWCPGIPGAGKTILSSIIIDCLRSLSSPAPVVLYIYCDYTHQSDQTSTQLLGSMLKQLVQHCPSISDHLVILHNNHLSQKTFPGVAELFTALQTETSFHEHVYIIVDALDECSEENQAQELFFPTNHASGQDQKTPLAYAAQQGHSDIVKLLLQRDDVNPESCDVDGCTPLSYAAEEGSLDIVKFL
ncbi:hypothetical protein C8J56DRAFT_829768, partial [Mycena floridula]